ncbi:MAG: RNA polymerase sigma-54 factor, partial [Paludibacteraceae bacterium]|nr:RNA polymerase sigma-54 factor [Paludibacteraceae bacterium]
MQQKLSPQQIQVIKMLEIPTLELEERIRQELEENPALEEGKETSDEDVTDDFQDDGSSESPEAVEDFNWDDYIGDDDDTPDYKLYANNHSRDDKHEDIPFAAKDTFREHLLDQLNVQIFDSKTKSLAEYIIGNIDDEGYLRRTVDSMIDDLAFQFGTLISEKEMLNALDIVQSFDPAGVGAQTLQECLLLQIKQRNKSEQQQLAQTIIERFFDEFTKKQYGKIAKRLNLSNETLSKAIDEILKLNPKPGNTWNSGEDGSSQTIIPDFAVYNENGLLQTILNNQNIPDLRVSNVYSNMIQDFAGNKKNQTNEMKNAVS